MLKGLTQSPSGPQVTPTDVVVSGGNAKPKPVARHGFKLAARVAIRNGGL